MSVPRLIVVLFLAAACSCISGGVNQRLSDLEAEEERRQQKLHQLDAQISVAEERIAGARADAHYHECLAKKAEIESSIAIEKAECVRSLAERSACISKNEARTTKGTGAGCAAGWLLTFLSAGAAAPLVAAGCLTGAALSEVSKTKCGEVPACGMVDDLAPAVLRRYGISQVPRCDKPTSEPVPAQRSRAPTSPAPGIPQAESCQRWRLEWVEFDVPRHKRSGDAWDPDGSGPDLMYTIFVDGKRVYRSPKYEAFVWNHSPPGVTVASGQAITIELVDRDLVSADRIADFHPRLPERPSNTPMTLMVGRTQLRVLFSCSGSP
jgi:hypothetical protein